MTSAGIMPQTRAMLSVLLASAAVACSFHADYGGGTYKCSDGICPSGLTCIQGTCATGGGSADAAIDSRQAALTCADPGLVATTGGAFMGTTAGRSNTVTASCNGGVMNGPDAVYRFDATIGDQLTLAISGSYPVNAYAIAPCTVAPGTPTCIGNTAAASGNPITITAAFTGAHFVVVDGLNPAQSGSYTLTITR